MWIVWIGLMHAQPWNITFANGPDQAKVFPIQPISLWDMCLVPDLAHVPESHAVATDKALFWDMSVWDGPSLWPFGNNF